MSKKLRVGILGATGMVGQQYISLLEDHPWFEVVCLVASERSAGQKYGSAVAGRWHVQKPVPNRLTNVIVRNIDDISAIKKEVDFVFSAVDSSVAKIYEEKYAAADIPVVSNASFHRMDSDVPMLIPEINASHLEVIAAQRKNHGWKKGFIVVKPNCSIQSYMTPLFALHKEFVVEKVIVTTMQAVSGAGHPGVSSFDIIDNVIPFISGEEEKSEKEPLKILGSVKDGKIIPYSGLTISAHCNRVPVVDGHTACVSVKFKKKPTISAIKKIWKEFSSVPQQLKLPFAPSQPIIYMEEENRPQPRLDRDNDKGMAISVGRLRECNVLDYRFVGLHHNTIRGAAGGGILMAELLVKKGYL